MTALIGNPLPHIGNASGFPAALPPSVIRVVARAISHAWDLICANPSQHLMAIASGAPEEDVYSEAICELLMQMLDSENAVVPGFTSEIFDKVSRGENVSNYNGSLINKQPDIVIRLAHSPIPYGRRFVGIFIESKVVCMAKSMSLYTTQGLHRFVVGDYGWAMQAGMMLAYRKPKHRNLNHLETQLNSEPALLSIAVSGKHLDVKPAYAPVSAVSAHQRAWSYVGGGNPGDIRIWHMWDLVMPI